jgi:hypothetical protein
VQHSVKLQAATLFLHQPELLVRVLGFLEGQGLFINLVSRSWRACFRDVVGDRTSPSDPEHVHTSNCTSEAAPFDSPSMLQLAIAWGLRFRPPHYEAAGYWADIDTLVTAQQHGLHLTHLDLIRSAARSTSLAKLQWLCDEHRCSLPGDITSFAAGSIEMLQWLKQRGCVFDARTGRGAARRPRNLPVLRYLKAEGCPFPKDICAVAALAGDLEQLQWLRQQGCALGSATATAAIDSSNAVCVLEWLQQQGVRFNYETMRSAAQAGATQLCQWLHDNAGCEWEAGACERAASFGHRETLRYLRQHGSPWNAEDVCLGAVSFPDTYEPSTPQLLQYLLDEGAQIGAELLTRTLSCAGSESGLAAVQWLRQHGAEWPAVLQDCCYGDPWLDDCVAWARAEGCTSPDELPHDQGFDY